MANFISCDWGTSNFRLRLIDGDKGSVLAELENTDGISSIFQQWQDANSSNERVNYFRQHLSTQIGLLEKKSSQPITEAVVVVSGMASSSIGMQELPYHQLPMNVDGSDLLLEKIDATPDFRHDMILISGVAGNDDIMRGEETMLIGCDIPDSNENQLYVFPGTHSKHVWVNNRRATEIQTFMTGEIFSLLSKHSILSGSLQIGNKLDYFDDATFEKGVVDGTSKNILHTIFQVRVNFLMNKMDALENYQYLSGLLIGTELKDIKSKPISLITVISNRQLIEQYKKAVQIIGLKGRLRTMDAATALINGQHKIMRRMFETA